MMKTVLALLAAFVIALAVAVFFFRRPPEIPANECERDCMNDSGGKAYCADFCKSHGGYGPAKK